MKNILFGFGLLSVILGYQAGASIDAANPNDPIPKGTHVRVLKMITNTQCPRVVTVILNGIEVREVVWNPIYFQKGKATCTKPLLGSWCKVDDTGDVVMPTGTIGQYIVRHTQTAQTYDVMMFLKIPFDRPPPAGFDTEWTMKMSCSDQFLLPLTSLEKIRLHMNGYLEFNFAQ